MLCLISPQNALRALVVRIDRWEYIGYFTDLKGPLAAGSQGCIFDAWRGKSHGGSLNQAP